MYFRKNGCVLARSFIAFAMGLLSCLKARTPSFITGKAPTTIFIYLLVTTQSIGDILKEDAKQEIFFSFTTTLKLWLNSCIHINSGHWVY